MKMELCNLCLGSGQDTLQRDHVCNRCNGFGTIYDNGGMIVPIDTDTNAPCIYCGQMTTWQVDSRNICEDCTYKYREMLLKDTTA